MAIGQIFAMGAVGFWLVRSGAVNDAGLKMLSFISVNIAFPMFIFNQILHNFDPIQTPGWWAFPLINISLAALGLTVASLGFYLTGRKIRDEVLLASSFHNAGYIPLLLSMTLPLGVLAGKVYTAIILSIIGFDICLWSVGLWLMTRAQKPKIDLRNMLNPPLVSMAAAVSIVLICGPLHIDDIWLKPVKIIGDSAMALSMLIIGGNLALTKLTKLHAKGMVGAVLLKTMVMPAIALGVLVMLKLDPVLSFVVMVQACMPTAITLSIIGRHNGTRNQDFINTAVFVTHLVCVLTLPIFLGLFGHWMHS